MTSFSFWQRWLLAVSIIIAIFGVMMVFLSGTVLFDFFNRKIDPAFWSTGIADHVTRQFQQWIYGVWGATIAGWGVILTYIAHDPFKRREHWAWKSVAFGLLVWFVLDTSLSLFHKVYFNAAFNIVLLVLAGLPVVFTRQEFA